MRFKNSISDYPLGVCLVSEHSGNTKSCTSKIYRVLSNNNIAASIGTSVADPDPLDPHVFVPPGSGSISQKYGSEVLDLMSPLLKNTDVVDGNNGNPRGNNSHVHARKTLVVTLYKIFPV